MGPSVPAAPGRFSIVIDCPRCFSVAVASARITRSVVPPAGHGTISVTGRDGKLCASAPDAAKPTAAADRTAMILRCTAFSCPPRHDNLRRAASLW
jgi:hypothetical protein